MPKQIPNKAQSQAALKATVLTAMITPTTITTAAPVAKLHTSIVQAQSAFTGTIKRIMDAKAGVTDAQGVLDAAGEAQIGVRQAILCELALLADKGNWLPEHAKAGIDAAIAAFEEAANDKEAAKKTAGTLRQFASECMRAVHPKAREHVAEAFEEATRVWDEEGERLEAAKAAAKAAGKKFVADPTETPLRTAFKRKWHMVAGSTGLLAAHASDDAERNLLAEAPDMLADAVVHDERTDAKRAAKAIKRVVAMIEGVAEEFPSDRWDTVVRFLSALKPEQLAAFRARDQKARTNPMSSKPARKAEPSVDDMNTAQDEMLDDA